jgi:prepilin-type N-terminal cleavage/methylation domain-containing protein
MSRPITNKGFTLVELSITVAIIILFSTVIYTNLNGSKAKTRDAIRMGDVKNLSLAAENYFSEHGSFATDINQLDEYFGTGGAGSIPKDPQGADYQYYLLPHGFCVGGVMERQIPSPEHPGTICPTTVGNYIIKGP